MFPFPLPPSRQEQSVHFKFLCQCATRLVSPFGLRRYSNALLLPPLFHASDDGRFSLSDQQKYGKFQREEGSRRARRKEGRKGSRQQHPGRPCAVKARRILSRTLAYLVSRSSPPLPLLRSEGAAFKASVLKSVVKRFHVGLRNFEAAEKKRRRN